MSFNLMKRAGAAVLSGILALSIVGCGAKTDSTSSMDAAVTTASAETTTAAETTAASETASATAEGLVDREGKAITPIENVEKIVAMGPSITETLVHLGLGDKIIAVDTYSTGIEGLPDNLPTFDMMAPDTESIAALKPEILISTGMSQVGGEDPYKAITDLGVVMTYIPSSESIDGIKKDILFLGDVTGTSDKADELVKTMEQEIDGIVTKIGENKAGKKVFFEIAAAPDMYSFGKGVFLNEIIELLGCENILADQNSWVSVSEEVVLQKNPDVIFTNVDYMDDPVADVLNRNGWDVVTAVKEKQVYAIDKNASSRPNETITAAIKEMATALYPDLFQ